jgi:hypothetical protein
MNFLEQIKKRLAGYIAPIQVSVREANRRAQALPRFTPVVELPTVQSVLVV